MPLRGRTRQRAWAWFQRRGPVSAQNILIIINDPSNSCTSWGFRLHCDYMIPVLLFDPHAVINNMAQQTEGIPSINSFFYHTLLTLDDCRSISFHDVMCFYFSNFCHPVHYKFYLKVIAMECCESPPPHRSLLLLSTHWSSLPSPWSLPPLPCPSFHGPQSWT